jgi:hypothetical protein
MSVSYHFMICFDVNQGLSNLCHFVEGIVKFDDDTRERTAEFEKALIVSYLVISVEALSL